MSFCGEERLNGKLAIICSVHNKPCKKIDIKNFICECEECENENITKDNNIRIDEAKLFINNYFPVIRKLISPERRRWLLAPTSFENLQVKCQFIYQLVTYELHCDTHENNLAVYFDLVTFKLKCSECSQINSEYIAYLNTDINKIIGEILIRAKESDISLLDKSHYDLCKKSFSNNIVSLILLGKSIVEKFEVKIPRCCVCCKKISFGALSGVKNLCGHVLCFKCCTNENPDLCSICKSKIHSLEGDVEVDILYYNITCHYRTAESNKNSTHGLICYQDKVYKLPCLHNVCEDHIQQSDRCMICNRFFEITNLKLNTKLMNIIDILKLYCEDHKELAIKFDYFACKAICKKCKEVEPSSSLSNENAICEKRGSSYLLSVAKSITYKLKNQLIDKDFKKRKIDQTTLKAVINYLRLPLNIVYRITKNYELRENLKSLSPYSSFIRFNGYFPQNRSFNLFSINEGELCGFVLKPSADFLLNGIIIGNPIRRTMSGYLYHSTFTKLIIDIIISEKKTHKFIQSLCFPYGIIDENNLDISKIYSEILFPYSIAIKEEKNYTIKVHTKGTFFHGRPYERKIDPNFTITRLKNEKAEKGNNAIGGMIFGLIYSEKKYFILSECYDHV